MDKKNTKSYLNDYKSEQARVLYASLPLASLINLTLGFILAVILHDIIEFHRIASWYAVIVAAVILRMMLYLWRKTSGQLTAESVKWIFLFRLGTAIIGCGWLLSLFLVFPSGNIPYQVLLAFVLGGMAAGAIASLGIDLISISLFAVPVVGGLSARFFFEDGDIPFSMSLMTFLFLIFTMLIARRTNRSIFENLILRIEKEKSEIDIRKNEARLNMAQSVSRTGSFDWDPVTGELFWSDQHYLLWGFSPGDVTPAYEVFISGIHPDDASYVKEVLQAALNGGEFYDCKHRVIHPDGKILYIHGRGKVTFDQTGKPLQMDGTVQDISDQVQAKKELENALERLRKTSSSVPGVVYEFKLDSQGNYSFPFSSDALDEVFEVRPEDLAKDSSLVFSKMHKDDLPVVMESIQKSAERITPWQHEFRIVKKDGSVRWLYGNSLPDKNPDGSISWYGFITDVTDKIEKETELKIAAVAFDSHEGIVITDGKGVILKCNRAFTEISGYSQEEAVGKTPGQILKSGRHDHEFYKRMWDDLTRKKFWQGEIWNKHKEGKVFPEWLTITAVSDPGGKVLNYVALIKDITEQKENEKIIHQLAFYDSLTNLPNRRLLIDRLNQISVSMSRDRRYAAILFIDLDNFKNLNDSRGHGVGDLMLVEVASRLKSCVRSDDTVSRFGGDEFVVILSNLSYDKNEAEKHAETISEKIRHVLTKPYSINSENFRSSPSIGICLFNDYEIDINELFRRADSAMYLAKSSGRNTIRFYDPDEFSVLSIRMNIEQGLNEALEKDQFNIYYQKQVDSSNNTFAAEALLRWNHPEQGLILPGGFIYVAEECGFITQLDRWVLQNACRKLKQWESEESTKHLSLSVNISAHHFHNADFLEFFNRLLDETKINPAKLKLELTESTLLTDIGASIKKINELKNAGVTFSMDDFGTGYSSLSYLSKLPIDQVKIDKSFMKNLNHNTKDDVIVETIISMAHSLGLDVIAEGVETKEQVIFLENSGCSKFQGFYFAKPLPENEFEKILKNQVLKS